MLKSIFRYLVSVLLLPPAVGIGYLTAQFILTPLTGTGTLLFLTITTLLSTVAFVFSLPQVETIFMEKLSDSMQIYWITIIAVFLISVGMAYLSVTFVGAEYTQFMAENTTG